MGRYPDRPSSSAELVGFLLLAFAVSWTAWLPLWWWTPPEWIKTILLIVWTFGPATAAIVMVVVRSGRVGLRAEIRSQWRWRFPPLLWLLVVFGPAVLILAAIGLARVSGAPAGVWQDPRRLYLVIPVFLYVLVLGGPLGEELGWRGFALSRLERRLRPTTAVLLLGLIWAVWHLPLFVIEGTLQKQLPPAAFWVQIVATSVIYGWLWNKTKSLPAVVIIHAAANTSVGLLPVLPEQAGSLIPLWTAVGLAVVVAFVMVAVTRGRLGHQVSSVAGEPPPERSPLR
jgi:hypothetical protein